jgi:hypothetical protein
MSNEAQIQISMNIDKQDDTGVLHYRAYPTQFAADVDGNCGPTPGAIQVSKYGTDVDLSQLTTPGLCRLTNQDADFWVEYGINEPDTTKFYPLGELLPGEFFIIRLSRQLGSEYLTTGTGTGVSGSSDNKLRFRAEGDATRTCSVLIEAFEK